MEIVEPSRPSPSGVVKAHHGESVLHRSTSSSPQMHVNHAEDLSTPPKPPDINDKEDMEVLLEESSLHEDMMVEAMFPAGILRGTNLILGISFLSFLMIIISWNVRVACGKSFGQFF